MARIKLGNLKGPKGDPGPMGPQGPQGIQGPPGRVDNIDLTPFVKKTEGTTLTGQYTFTNNTPIKLNGYDVVSENNRVLFKNASENNVFAFDANTITHNDKSLLTQDKANTLYAPAGDYALRSSLADYASRQYVNYAVKNFITTTNANSTYLSKTDASNTYAPKTALNDYVSKAGTNNVTGTINISQTAGLTLANHILESNPTNLVIKNKANQPILTVYPSVAYLNGREVLNQFKADQLYAPKTALNDYVTTSQYNNDMNSLLTALRNVNN